MKTGEFLYGHTIAPAASPFRDPGASPLDPAKFRDPLTTAGGAPRARVALRGLETLWFNTGTLCNLTCANCYIESSPRNDALTWLTAGEVGVYLDEIAVLGLPTLQIGFTGGEPFMNPAIGGMIETALTRGYETLVLTNALRPMRRWGGRLLALRARHGEALTLRVSLDHHTQAVHEVERGAGTWAATVDGLLWLSGAGFSPAVAGRRRPGESEHAARAGYGRLFASLGVALAAFDPARLVLFPEMDATSDVPEITEACWETLGRSPEAMMCASSRMVVKRRGAERPVVVACTLTPYDPGFELGRRLAESMGEVALNHPHCARFCVLGGASCGAR